MDERAADIARVDPKVPDAAAAEASASGQPSGIAVVPAHAKAVAGALRESWTAAWARRRERQALVRLGDALALARTLRAEPGTGTGIELEAAFEAVRRLEAGEAALETALAASLEADRADYARVAGWLRPVVIARGLADRCILRGRRRALLREREKGCQRIGTLAHDSLDHSPEGLVGEHLASARAARAEAEAAFAGRRALLERLGRPAVPAALPVLGREAGALGKSLAVELRGQLFPRLPALAGLGVGFFIANTFTDSSFSATLHSLGIGHGPSRVVRSDTYRAMQFWLPLVAAAVCSYAGGRLNALIERRYGTRGAAGAALAAVRGPEAEPPPGP